MYTNTRTWILLGALVFIAGCGSHESGMMTSRYSSTQTVKAVFQKKAIPASCRVFAQLFATFPTGYTGKEFADALTAEAQSKGADMMLIGQSRQCTTESDLSFRYFGPDREYRLPDWPGWSFGLEEWEEQGEWIGIGYNEWGNSSVSYDYPIILRAAFVRCQP